MSGSGRSSTTTWSKPRYVYAANVAAGEPRVLS